MTFAAPRAPTTSAACPGAATHEALDAPCGLDVRFALTAGSIRPAERGPVRGTWLVRAALPQVTLLCRAGVAVSHGGNNSVTAGVPLRLPTMSTDPFAGAAALENLRHDLTRRPGPARAFAALVG